VSSLLSNLVLGGLCVVALVGALVTVFAREVMRMVLGLGSLLLAVAGLFAYVGFGFLALAELFVYVGGVLILILFAIMLVHRRPDGDPDLGLRSAAVPAIASTSAAILLGAMMFPAAEAIQGATAPTGPAEVARVLTGPLLAPFEIAGALLLVALVAVVLVAGGERR
jgi:NADH-quinone oxidoreductase subunit J